MRRDMILRELALADDRSREDRVGRSDACCDDEGGEEVEAGDEGVDEGGGDHPAYQHAAKDVSGIWGGTERDRKSVV